MNRGDFLITNKLIFDKNKKGIKADSSIYGPKKSFVEPVSPQNLVTPPIRSRKIKFHRVDIPTVPERITAHRFE